MTSGAIGHIALDKVWPNAAALMTFNEPNHPEQSRLTPAQAAAAWPDVEKAARVNNISRIGELPSLRQRSLECICSQWWQEHSSLQLF